MRKMVSDAKLCTYITQNCFPIKYLLKNQLFSFKKMKFLIRLQSRKVLERSSIMISGKKVEEKGAFFVNSNHLKLHIFFWHSKTTGQQTK